MKEGRRRRRKWRNRKGIREDKKKEEQREGEERREGNKNGNIIPDLVSSTVILAKSHRNIWQTFPNIETSHTVTVMVGTRPTL